MRDLETLYKVPYHLPKPGAKVKKDSKGNLYWAFNSLYPNHEIYPKCDFGGLMTFTLDFL